MTLSRYAFETVVISAVTMGACSKASPDTSKAGHEKETVEVAGEKAATITGTSAGKFNPRLLRRFAPLRQRFESVPGDSNPDRVTLGRMLYYEKRLSKNQALSCNSCHHLDRYGVDGEPTSIGHKGQRGARNAPTVYNAAGQFQQFWDGRAPNVEEQAKGSILNPVEMAIAGPEQAARVLKSVPGYPELFARAFPGEPDPVTYDNIARAIGAFERGLTTPSRWDKYLKGEAALTADEMEGLHVFTNVGCMVCHTGELLGGSSYQRVGVVEPWPNQADRGRYAISKLESDRMSFKVPTLRNIQHTGPYFHDGSVPTLQGAVTMMGRHQLGLELSAAEVQSIVTWLQCLSGEISRDYIAEPRLPPNGPSTPGPDPT
ncbi:MAG TPA: cytochrome c peroxidase [Polyangiaceae bacterium]|nr:cytochrome c peroxidase [Polyangiaceae bacterium]